MHLESPNFSIEVPDTWGSVGGYGALVVSAAPQGGYQDNIVFLENRFAGSLAQAAAACEAALTRIPGGFIVEVDADVTADGLERRRIWALAPVAVGDMVSTVLMIQDVIVVDGISGQFTATLPLGRGADGWDAMALVLDTIRPLPAERRRPPSQESHLPSPVLDEARSVAVGRPIESLGVLRDAQPTWLDPQLCVTLTDDELAAWDRLSSGGRLFRPRVDMSLPAAEGLRAQGLIDGEGRATALTSKLQEGRRRGRHWLAKRQTDSDLTLELWTHDDVTLILTPPGADGRRRFGVAKFDETTRFVISWLNLTPTWPAQLELRGVDQETFFSHVMRARDLPGDPQNPLTTAPWTYLTIATPDGRVLKTWLWAEGVGGAFLTRQGGSIDAVTSGATKLWREVYGRCAALQLGRD